jgi:hypothetical protein
MKNSKDLIHKILLLIPFLIGPMCAIVYYLICKRYEKINFNLYAIAHASMMGQFILLLSYGLNVLTKIKDLCKKEVRHIAVIMFLIQVLPCIFLPIALVVLIFWGLRGYFKMEPFKEC